MKAERFIVQSTATKIMKEKYENSLVKFNIVKSEWDKSNDVIMKNLMISKLKEHHDLAIKLIYTHNKYY